MAQFFGPVVSPGILQALIASFQGRRDRNLRDRALDEQNEATQPGNILVRSLIQGIAAAPGQALGQLPGQLIDNANRRAMQEDQQAFLEKQAAENRAFERGPLMTASPAMNFGMGASVPPVMMFARDLAMRNQAMAPQFQATQAALGRQATATEGEKTRAHAEKLAGMQKPAPAEAPIDMNKILEFQRRKYSFPGQGESPTSMPLFNEGEARTAVGLEGVLQREAAAEGRNDTALLEHARKVKADEARARAADSLTQHHAKMAELKELETFIGTSRWNAEMAMKYKTLVLDMAKVRAGLQSDMASNFVPPDEQARIIQEFDSVAPRPSQPAPISVDENKAAMAKSQLMEQGAKIRAMPNGEAKKQAWAQWLSLAKQLGYQVPGAEIK